VLVVEGFDLSGWWQQLALLCMACIQQWLAYRIRIVCRNQNALSVGGSYSHISCCHGFNWTCKMWSERGCWDQPKMWKCSIEQLYQSPVVSKFQDTRHRPYVGLLGSESGVALFCEAVVDGLTTMLQEDHICVQTSSCLLVLQSACSWLASAW
jgi:hypothetical protein